MSPIKLAVFDVAGTIIEDHGEVLNAFRLALQQNGIHFAEDGLRHWRGASKREVIRHLVEQQFQGDSNNEQKTEITYARFRQVLETLYREGVRTIEGAGSTFSWCRERGPRAVERWLKAEIKNPSDRPGLGIICQLRYCLSISLFLVGVRAAALLLLVRLSALLATLTRLTFLP